MFFIFLYNENKSISLKKELFSYWYILCIKLRYFKKVKKYEKNIILTTLYLLNEYKLGSDKWKHCDNMILILSAFYLLNDVKLNSFRTSNEDIYKP